MFLLCHLFTVTVARICSICSYLLAESRLQVQYLKQWGHLSSNVVVSTKIPFDSVNCFHFLRRAESQFVSSVSYLEGEMVNPLNSNTDRHDWISWGISVISFYMAVLENGVTYRLWGNYHAFVIIEPSLVSCDKCRSCFFLLLKYIHFIFYLSNINLVFIIIILIIIHSYLLLSLTQLHW